MSHFENTKILIHHFNYEVVTPNPLSKTCPKTPISYLDMLKPISKLVSIMKFSISL